KMSLSLNQAIQDALRLVKEQGIAVEEKAGAELQRFFGERLRHYCQEVAKLRGDLVDAVLSRWQSGTFDPPDIVARVRVLQSFAARAEFDSLLVAYKRAENITKSHADDKVDEAALRENVERGLYAAVRAADEVVPVRIQ